MSTPFPLSRADVVQSSTSAGSKKVQESAHFKTFHDVPESATVRALTVAASPYMDAAAADELARQLTMGWSAGAWTLPGLALSATRALVHRRRHYGLELSERPGVVGMALALAWAGRVK